MANTEAPLSISFKTTRSTLITVRGDNHDELALNLAKMALPLSTDDGPQSIIDMIRDIEGSISGASAGGGGSAPQGGSQPQQASLTPACKEPGCGAGTTEKSGNGKRGPWKGYFCTVNKDHAVQWAS